MSETAERVCVHIFPIVYMDGWMDGMDGMDCKYIIAYLRKLNILPVCILPTEIFLSGHNLV
jgi:hypothetical protein